MNSNARSKKARKQPSVDGFIRRNPVDSGTIGQTLPHKKISTYQPTQGSGGQFDQPDGFNARLRTGKSQLPDGTKTGRNPISKSDINMDIDGADKKKKRLGKSRNWKKIIKRTFLVLIILVIAVAGFFYWRARQVFQGGESALALNCEVDPSLLQKEGDGRVNTLILGKGGPGHDGPDLTDTILVASIDSCQKEVGLVSIPRDLYVQMPGNGPMKINSIYPTAKEQALAEGKSKKEAEKIALGKIEETVEQVTSLPIHYYAMVDFKAFQKAIDTVGGVDVEVEETLVDPSVAWENDWNPIIAEKGKQHMDGKKALLFARSRYGSVRGDFDRSDRQRHVILALREKVLSLGTFSNPVKITQLLNAFGKHIQTNLSIDDLLKIYAIGQEVDSTKVKSIDLAKEPNSFVTTDNIDGLSVVIPKAGLYQYSQIQSYLRNKLRDGFLKKENASIVVLNGTNNSGAAKAYAKMLKSYGYKVSDVGDAPNKDASATTQLYDLRSGDKKYTKRYLELRTKSEANGKLPDGVNAGNADFVIIVGKQ